MREAMLSGCAEARVEVAVAKSANTSNATNGFNHNFIDLLITRPRDFVYSQAPLCDAPSTTLAQAACLGPAAEVWIFLAQRSGQIDLMVLLLHEDLANLFRHCELSQRFTLPDAIPVIANGVVLIVEIEPQHVFRILRSAYRLGRDHRHFAEVVDLPRKD